MAMLLSWRVSQPLKTLHPKNWRFTEALEAAASRASCELKEISGCHGKEVTVGWVGGIQGPPKDMGPPYGKP